MPYDQQSDAFEKLYEEPSVSGASHLKGADYGLGTVALLQLNFGPGARSVMNYLRGGPSALHQQLRGSPLPASIYSVSIDQSDMHTVIGDLDLAGGRDEAVASGQRPMHDLLLMEVVHAGSHLIAALFRALGLPIDNRTSISSFSLLSIVGPYLRTWARKSRPGANSLTMSRGAPSATMPWNCKRVA
uniref:Uncharacterized protein n=1 Tax=Pristionchus pacificus TaxID=54126 RepID=A0A8R1ZB30_PRIPA